MSKFIQSFSALIHERPLTFVILASLIPRIIAVIWSQGFVHSDDYYDTVMIAHSWLTQGLFHENGYLWWRGRTSEEIGRFPLYTLSLWSVMKIHYYLGVTSLETIMYTLRGLHALLSLAPVWACYRIVEIVTQDKRWAIGAGLYVGLNFALPFLGVRCLIEIVGGNIWLVAMYALYRWRDERPEFGALLAGLLTGLAWMVRFQIAFAALPIPFVLWYERKSIKPALWYSAGVSIMLVLSGFIDWYFLGEFARSTLMNLEINYRLLPLYDMSALFYLAIILLMMTPPASFVMLRWMFKSILWKNHLPLIASSFCFVLCHSVIANKQERFIFPIVTAFMTIGALALWYRWRERGYIFKSKALQRSLIGVAAVFNLVFLLFLTPAYTKKGLIEPVLEIKKLNSSAHVLFIQPDLRHYIPFEYAAPAMGRYYLREWRQMDDLRNIPDPSAAFDFIVIYPPDKSDLPAYLDSTQSALGELEFQFSVEPSYYDELIQTLNPKHNPDFAAYVYTPAAP
ncbi:MAG: hypothetical protein IH914_03730 [candidate division Zixibacteria bacterium]|nr:hypothetical protein [candidate division Zixibacteria bacterium]